MIVLIPCCSIRFKMKNLQAFILFGGLLLLDSKAAAQDVPDYVPTDGLVAWYPFNGNAQDESGQGLSPSHPVRCKPGK